MVRWWTYLRSRAALALVPVVAALGCDSTGPTNPLTIKFGTRAPAGSAVMGAAALEGTAAAQQELVITGTNGTLQITDIRLIVDEFELERAEVADCDVEPEPEGCADFEARFLFVDVPLGDTPLTVATDDVPAGTYEELEFEVEDLETDADDPEDAAEAQMAQALLNTIRQTFSDWPDKASMVVVGTFTPTGGTAKAFKAYFEAEIEVELEFPPPGLVIGDTPESVVIELNPSAWFKKADGTVLDLSQFDFATSQQLVQFQLEIEGGFELEIET